MCGRLRCQANCSSLNKPGGNYSCTVCAITVRLHKLSSPPSCAFYHTNAHLVQNSTLPFALLMQPPVYKIKNSAPIRQSFPSFHCFIVK
jgi:hypothetical protein